MAHDPRGLRLAASALIAVPWSDSSVAVIGDALLDVRVAPRSTIRTGGDVPASIGIAPGGQGANVAVRLARRRVPVTLHAAIGADAAGDLVRATLAADGVRLAPVTAEATGVVAVVVDPSGERTMFSQRAPFAERVDVPDAAWTVVSGYLLTEPSAATLAAALARRRGRLAILGCDVAPDRRSAWVAAAGTAQPDLVVLNSAEASWAGSFGELRAVTDALGASASFGAVSARYDLPPSVPVDTTGAGDAFAAALLAEIGMAWPPAEGRLTAALEAACDLAAEVTAVPGAQGRVPTEDGRLAP